MAKLQLRTVALNQRPYKLKISYDDYFQWVIITDSKYPIPNKRGYSIELSMTDENLSGLKMPASKKSFLSYIERLESENIESILLLLKEDMYDNEIIFNAESEIPNLVAQKINEYRKRHAEHSKIHN